MAENSTTEDLREVLLDSGRYLDLTDYFIEKAADELQTDDDQEGLSGPRFSDYFRLAVRANVRDSAGFIERNAESPIERIFLRSLLLSFIKNDGLGLVVHPVRKNAITEIDGFRSDLGKWRKFFQWFQSRKPASSIDAFLDEEVARGRLPADERETYRRWACMYGYVPMDTVFHMSLQPRFPTIKVDGRGIRPDIYFWIPTAPSVKIVVECDGFQYHSSKERFISDRRRDRVLQAQHFQVLRFSGSEIYRDPVHSAHELACYLWDRVDEGKSIVEQSLSATEQSSRSGDTT